MNTKTVYQYDNEGLLIGEKILDETDKSTSGLWQIPWGYTEIKPIETKEGFRLFFNGTKWEYREIPKEEPQPDETVSNIDIVETLTMTSLQVDVLEAITGLNDIVMSQAAEIAALKEGVKQ